VPYIPRSPKQIDGCFEGLEKVEPGLVPVSRWRPEIGGVDAAAVQVAGFSAVARKP
jgi:S-adenosyl methyltransferase